MEQSFFKICGADKKSRIEIQAIGDYDSLSLLTKGSTLELNNNFFVVRGTKWFDVTQFADSVSNFAISKRIKEILEANNVTGWSCFPIVIKGYSEEYFAFQVISKAGRILNLESINNYETKFIEFDITTWDGSDIFTLERTTQIVITPKVKEILEKAKITNLDITHL
ncbi:MAG: hypothetical protein ACO1O6_00235 [Bacteroidota bacterium]